MTSWFLRRTRFLLERWVQRGVLHQLLLMAGLIAAVAVLGGCAAWALTPRFEHLGPAIWWSFLRLTDPGYLGDDEGAALRLISTIVTILGYVLFMGSLIAIMTQWLARTIRKLENGLTPISMENHFVILGWTNRTPEILKRLLATDERVKRFLARRGVAKLRVVVLADEVTAELRLGLRESLGKDWHEKQVFLRSGSSLQQEHLARLDLRHAAVVMIPGADFALGGAELTDTRVVKTLLNLDALFSGDYRDQRKVPHVVAELFDPNKVPIARNSVHMKTEIIAGDRLICRLLLQSLRHADVGRMLLHLLSHPSDNSIYLRAFSELAGVDMQALAPVFPRAVVLGYLSMEGGMRTVRFNPSGGACLKEGDSLIFLARNYSHCSPNLDARISQPPAHQGPLPPGPGTSKRRLLILGWSNKLPTLLSELLESSADIFEITILSQVSQEARCRALDHLSLEGNIGIKNVVGDYALEHEMRALEPQRFDHILFMGSGWMESSEEADARTVLGLLLLRNLLHEQRSAPQILVEFLDPDNARILRGAAEVVFVSPLMLSHLLALVGMRPDLNAVFDELTSSNGTSIDLRRPQELGLPADHISFSDAQLAAARRGCTALGFSITEHAGRPSQAYLNPDRTRSWKLLENDRVVVLQSEHLRVPASADCDTTQAT